MAIWIGDVGGNKIAENVIENFGYTAISVGWPTGARQSRGNLIENNRISNIGRGLLSDLGGIYTLGDLAETVIRGNKIDNVRHAAYGGFGIYLDRESSGVEVSTNEVRNTGDAPIALHFAQSNRIVENRLCAVEGRPAILVIKAGKAENVIGNNLCAN